MEIKEIAKNVEIMGKSYCSLIKDECKKTVENIENFLIDNDFGEIESHDNGRHVIYNRSSTDKAEVTDELCVHFDLEHSRVSVSYHEICNKCREVLNALGDDLDVCECRS